MSKDCHLVLDGREFVHEFLHGGFKFFVDIGHFGLPFCKKIWRRLRLPLPAEIYLWGAFDVAEDLLGEFGGCLFEFARCLFEDLA